MSRESTSSYHSLSNSAQSDRLSASQRMASRNMKTNYLLISVIVILVIRDIFNGYSYLEDNDSSMIQKNYHSSSHDHENYIISNQGAIKGISSRKKCPKFPEGEDGNLVNQNGKKDASKILNILSTNPTPNFIDKKYNDYPAIDMFYHPPGLVNVRSDFEHQISNTRNASYLLPILHFQEGPNNLFRMFKETALIAYQNQQAIAFPVFHTHQRMGDAPCVPFRLPVFENDYFTDFQCGKMAFNSRFTILNHSTHESSKPSAYPTSQVTTNTKSQKHHTIS